MIGRCMVCPCWSGEDCGGPCLSYLLTATPYVFLSSQPNSPLDESNDLCGDFSPNIYNTTESSGSKRMRQSQGSRISKKGAGRMIKDHLSGLMIVCKEIQKGETSDKPSSSLEESIKVLSSIPEVYNDDPLYIFATSFLEDANKRAIVMAMPAKKRLKWLTHFYLTSSSTPSTSESASMEPNKKSLFIKLVMATIVVIYEYYNTYLCKTPRMTSSFNDDIWIGELLAEHPKRESMRATCERFQHSSETVSQYFSLYLNSLVGLAREVIIPIEGSFDETPQEIINDSRYYPFFKDCIEALDGTHVDVCVPVFEQIAYIGRCGSPTQNVLACCDFNMCFTFIMAGWEGSAHDSIIFKFATRNPAYNFPMPPPGKYYLVDAGFPMERGFLKPYPDTKYHIPDFQRSSEVIRNRRELFNKRHSSLRGVIERTFGVWKKNG